MISSSQFIKDFKVVWNAMDNSDRSKFLKSIFVNLFIAFFELIGVTSLIPFLGLLSEGEKVLSHAYVQPLKIIIPNLNLNQLIIFSGSGVVLLLITSNIALFMGKTYSFRSSSEIVHSLSRKIFNYYLNCSYGFHISQGSTLLLTRISLVSNLASGFLFALLDCITRGTLIAFILVTLLFVNPFATTFVSIVFGFCYFFLYRKVQKKVKGYGYDHKLAMKKRSRVVTEGLRSIKDVIVCRYQKLYSDAFDSAGSEMWNLTSQKQKLAIFPRYLLESLTFGLMTTFAIVLSVSGQEFAEIIPQLTLFTVLGYKLLPAGQSIYASLVSISTQASTFDELSNDFINLSKLDNSKKISENLEFKKIELKDIFYTHQKSSSFNLKNISLKLEKGERLGIVGPSGSGKTTLIDLILGLYEPSSGKIRFEVNHIASKFFDFCSYVPQNIYILNATLEENITVGEKDINQEKLHLAIKCACLEDFVSSLPDGAKTVLSEDGGRLSGGQKQRVGIARAVYRNSEVLVLDEATSALDKPTEAQIYKNLSALGKALIIVTHELGSLKDCDQILLMHNGEIEMSGTYDYLINFSERFRSLADIQLR